MLHMPNGFDRERSHPVGPSSSGVFANSGCRMGRSDATSAVGASALFRQTRNRTRETSSEGAP